jgi:uncharacterized protein
MDRERFLELRNQYLTSARPIQTPEHLKGRDRALSRVVDALRSPGRHAFIYGFRGVGKTSLAHTAAYQIQNSAGAPVLCACDYSSTFNSVSRDIVRQALRINPLERKSALKLNLGGNLAQMGGVNAGFERNSQQPSIEINNVSDALEYLRATLLQIGCSLVVVIDEFDQVTNKEEHKKFASLIKQVSDQSMDIKFIFCGIAETVERLFSEHQSVFRQMHSEKVDQLIIQARIDIIEDAADALEITIENGRKYRISQISDGFPSFIHLITEKIFTAAFDNGRSAVSASDYEDGLEAAISSVELTLKKSYEDALHKNTRKYEHVIWSVASDQLLDLNVDNVWKHYMEICGRIRENPVSRSNLNTKLNQLCEPAYGSILFKPRRSNYTFSEKMMRAYARLRAERLGCPLGVENPMR